MKSADPKGHLEVKVVQSYMSYKSADTKGHSKVKSVTMGAVIMTFRGKKKVN